MFFQQLREANVKMEKAESVCIISENLRSAWCSLLHLVRSAFLMYLQCYGYIIHRVRVKLGKILTSCDLIVWIYCRIPIWSYAKLILTSWLVIPYFSGAAYVYEHYVRPFFVSTTENVNIWYVPSKKDSLGKPEDMLTAAEKYIEEHGTEAFENLLNKVFHV